MRIRRIEEDKIPGVKAAAHFPKQASQVVVRFGLNDLALAFLNSTKIQIGFDQGAHLSRTINKRYMPCPARQGFNPDRS